MRSFYPPLSINAPFSGYLKLVKLHRKEKKVKQGYDVIGDRTRDLAHQRPRTNQPCHPWSLILALTELPAWDSQSVRRKS